MKKGTDDHPYVGRMHREFLRPVLNGRADTVVVGCTHYILLAPAIRALVGARVNIIEPSTAVAEQLKKRLAEATSTRREGPIEDDEFYTSPRQPERVGEVASQLLGKNIRMVSEQTLIARNAA